MSLARSMLEAAERGLNLTPSSTLGTGTRMRDNVRKTRSTHWGLEEDSTLLSMRKLGLAWNVIGEALDRSHEGCRQRHMQLTNRRGCRKCR